MTEQKKHTKGLSRALGVVLLFVGIGGLSGGTQLVMDPSGAAIGFEPQVLKDSPFSDFLIPGLFILIVNGLLSCILGIAAIRQHKRTGEIGIFFGVWLVSYMIAQAWWIGFTAFIQYLFLAVGLVVLALGTMVHARTRQ